MSFPDWSTLKHVVVLTGAGISAESGIKTFRDAGGLWENHRVEDVATPEAFARDPHLVWRFYSMRRLAAAHAAPNLAHRALVQFSKAFQGHFTLVTQNVDTLHERANAGGTLDPLCMHGSLEKSRCTSCGVVYLDDTSWLQDGGGTTPTPTGLLLESQLASSEALSQYPIKTRENLPLSPCCEELLRPHIVWFGEMPLSMDRIYGELEDCDLFVSIGTSGQVYPAAAFVEVAKRHGALTACLNLEPIPQSSTIDHFEQGPASFTVPKFFALSKV